MQFSATLSVKNADLSFSTSDCGSATPSIPTQLSIIPVGYGTQCYEEQWNAADMFGGFTPAEPVGTYTITGGTGRFEHATGSGDLASDVGPIDPESGASTVSANWTGTISY